MGVVASVVLVEAGAQLAFGAGENQAQDGLAAGVGFVIDLVVGVGGLEEGAAVEGGRGPGAGAGSGVGGLHVVFDDGAVGLRGDGRAVEAVSGEAVVVRAVVEHGSGAEGGRGGAGGVAVEYCSDHAVDLFVKEAGGDGDGFDGFGDGGEVSGFENEGGEVGAARGVGGAGGAAGNLAGGPVLARGVGERWVDEFEASRTASSPSASSCSASS